MYYFVQLLFSLSKSYLFFEDLGGKVPLLLFFFFVKHFLRQDEQPPPLRSHRAPGGAILALTTYTAIVN